MDFNYNVYEHYFDKNNYYELPKYKNYILYKDGRFFNKKLNRKLPIFYNKRDNYYYGYVYNKGDRIKINFSYLHNKLFNCY